MRKFLSASVVASLFLFTADVHATLMVERPLPRLRTRVMALGDSLTVGWNMADDTASLGGYRAQLSMLTNNRIEWVGRQNHGPFNARRHEGWGGFQIRRLQQLELANAMQRQADIVLLMIGTNDAWHPFEYDSLSTRENMTSNLTSLLNDLWSYQPNVRVILSTLPYIHDAPSLQAVQTYNASLPGVVSDFALQGKQIHLVDSYAFMSPEETAVDSDGVHPNALGYRHIADAFYSDPWLNFMGGGTLSVVPEPVSAGATCIVLFALFSARRRCV